MFTGADRKEIKIWKTSMYPHLNSIVIDRRRNAVFPKSIKDLTDD